MGNVFYYQTTDANLLARATNEIQSAFPTSSNLPIKNLFIATWNNVGYNFRNRDKVKININENKKSKYTVMQYITYFHPMYIYHKL